MREEDQRARVSRMTDRHQNIWSGKSVLMAHWDGKWAILANKDKVKSTLEVLKEFGGDINQRCHSGFIPIQEAVLNRSDPAAVVSAL